MTDTAKPTTETRNPNLSTDHQRDGDALRPNELLDKDRKPEQETKRKTSLT